MTATMPPCPNLDQHTPRPEGIQWYAWAARMSRTHKQVRCAACGRFSIWIPRKRETLAIAEARRTGKAVVYTDKDGCEVTAMPSGHAFYNVSDWW
jgi:hypothetical protein